VAPFFAKRMFPTVERDQPDEAESQLALGAEVQNQRNESEIHDEDRGPASDEEDRHEKSNSSKVDPKSKGIGKSKAHREPVPVLRRSQRLV
jgi:hypothetical protein